MGLERQTCENMFARVSFSHIASAFSFSLPFFEFISETRCGGAFSSKFCAQSLKPNLLALKTMPGIGRETPRKEHQIGEKVQASSYQSSAPIRSASRPDRRTEPKHQKCLLLCVAGLEKEKKKSFFFGARPKRRKKPLEFPPVFLPSSALVEGLFQQPIFNKSLSTKQQKNCTASETLWSIVSAGETARKKHFCRCWMRRLSMLIPLTQSKNVLDKRLSGC
ncbi:hypothetical protein Ddc_15464 [Ditylenchus destructor]|nr:hypothetical protein Ddc_15464 [Ditylenchus destructor]